MKAGYRAMLALAAGTIAIQGAGAGDRQQADYNRGKQLARTCAACHGADGNSPKNSSFPNLAGQLPDYIVLQLQNFKSGERPVAVMQALATPLSQKDMLALASFYAAQRPRPRGQADRKLADAGKEIFSKGSAGGAPACAACHGAKGQGQAPVPRISSQPAPYLMEQLGVYRNGGPFGNPLARQMQEVARKLNDDEVRAVAAYLANHE